MAAPARPVAPWSLLKYLLAAVAVLLALVAILGAHGSLGIDTVVELALGIIFATLAAVVP